jgi:hypothetical protein
VTGLLREPLSLEQSQLLQVIYEPFDQSGRWPVWQYVDLTMDARHEADAADVLASLQRIGDTGPMSRSYGLTWREDSHLAVPNPDQHVALTVAGLCYLRPATEPLLLGFLVTMRCLVEAQRKLVPSPSQVVEASVSSATIRERLAAPLFGASLPAGDAALQRMRRLLRHEPFLYNVVLQPKPDIEEWTVRVPAVLRAYRDISSVDEYLDRLVDQVAPPVPPSAPPSPNPLDIPYAAGYLDAVWKSKTGSHLFVNLDPASVARLTLECSSEEEFNSLMSALADVLAQVVEPGQAKPPPGGALEKIEEYLSHTLDAEAAARSTNAIRTLVRLRRIRVSTQHSDARHKAVATFSEIGLAFPPVSWDQAWEHIATLAVGALDSVREEVHAGIP